MLFTDRGKGVKALFSGTCSITLKYYIKHYNKGLQIIKGVLLYLWGKPLIKMM